MMINSIIFDVDGTLWDSVEEVSRSWRNTVSSQGIDGSFITADRLRVEFGKPMEAIGLSLFPDMPEKDAISLTKLCCDLEIDDLRKDPPSVYKGVKEVFKTLKERGIPALIVSNCQSGYIEVLMETNGLRPYVTGHLCPGDTGLLKADNIRLISERFNLKNPVYVGDTMGDYTATKAAGLPFVFAAYGFGYVSDPDGVINTPTDILSLI